MHERIRTQSIAALALFLFMGVGIAHAGIVVIGNPNLPVDHLTKRQIEEYFLGKRPTFPDGTSVKVFDHQDGERIKDRFYKGIIGKTPEQLKAYWARAVFTGMGIPPTILRNDKAIIDAVASTPGGIAYVDSASVNGSVKVLWKQ